VADLDVKALLAPLRGRIEELVRERDRYRELAFEESRKVARLEGEIEQMRKGRAA
jgi:hypothetical protein